MIDFETIREALTAQSRKIDAILEQVIKTNSRVDRLEVRWGRGVTLYGITLIIILGLLFYAR